VIDVPDLLGKYYLRYRGVLLVIPLKNLFLATCSLLTRTDKPYLVLPYKISF
jgi:hypothetical protein